MVSALKVYYFLVNLLVNGTINTVNWFTFVKKFGSYLHMISRRHLRVKVLQELYAYNKAENPSINQFEKELFYSIHKTYDLYHYYLQLFVEVGEYAQSRIELALNKKVPTQEDLNPNTRFVNNKAIALIRNNDPLMRYLQQSKFSWKQFPEIVKSIYNSIRNSDYFLEYMAEPAGSFKSDRKLLTDILEKTMVNDPELTQWIEDQSILWIDDIEPAATMTYTTLSKLKETDPQNWSLLPEYKDTDDMEFVKTLFRKAVLNRVDYTTLIENQVENWDVERIAFMDVLIMQMAIAEFIEFPSIPVKVSINEYLEISKLYSTEKSNVFINGVLDKIVDKLKSENRIIKTGRGLIEETSK